MKRFIFLLLAVLGLSIYTTPVHAAVNDFVISDYDISYTLGRDETGRSTLRTVETITAEFPMTDQNHGIERAIPKSYDGHSTSVSVESVTTPDGVKWNYSTHTSNDNLVVRIGDASRYVHGTHTFVLTYTQRDVTGSFSDTGRDEFYWDTNGTEWRVPIQNLSVELKVDQSLATALTGDTACYRGKNGANNKCELVKEVAMYRTEATSLAAGENVTIAIGFTPGTFAVYEESLMGKFVVGYVVASIIIGLIGIGLIIWIIVKSVRWSRRSSEVGTIIPEYLPPQDTSVTLAASIRGGDKSAAFTAQLLDFAVRHYIRIYQTSEKSLFRQAEYEIEIIRDISDLKAEEQEIIRDIFPEGQTSVGTRLPLKDLRNNTKVYRKTLDNDKKLNEMIEGQYALRAKDEYVSAKLKRWGKVLLVASVVLLSPVLLIAAIVAFVSAHVLRPLTDKGLALSRHLKGLQMYIDVAEQERLRMLQSPEGAAKVGAVNVSDSAQLVKLYERVLPYAVLFGQEKEWNKRIGALYEATGNGPDWFVSSSTMFNAAVFSSAMSSFTTQSSYSAASSSTSGGSGGGGFSGGGGGGGGGGGW